MVIIARNQWCTEPRNRASGPISVPTPRLWLHHGASGISTIATANAYARYHIRNLDWNDIGYSFLIANGQVLEGRGAGISGSHTRGDNSSSHGICLVGDYTSRVPAEQDVAALVWLLRHGGDQGWWDPAQLTGGHRDAPGASTSCPGQRAHQLIPVFNAEAAKRAPAKAQTSWEILMSELTEREREVLKSFASQAVRQKTRGDSIVRQFLEFNRGGEREFLQEMIRHVRAKGTTVQGLVRGATNLFRAAKDDYNVDTS